MHKNIVHHRSAEPGDRTRRQSDQDHAKDCEKELGSMFQTVVDDKAPGKLNCLIALQRGSSFLQQVRMALIILRAVSNGNGLGRQVIKQTFMERGGLVTLRWRMSVHRCREATGDATAPVIDILPDKTDTAGLPFAL
ncbi:hypothetical protein MRS76_13485 [Rhizobiaceae bacterium n13]|uniref:Uncharacterized protein n=1 Tax=Ferirhizobium litorale TaxID=2927786 RepID=A0AAE3U527_9HYPH|nr:hypothetical protein [Fererhizobium litorale]MDI7862970.1 hypothetical protein [Fererhizobium litorale]MDI7924043.1 hypothetical protein [Fererhizobium litorale]